MASSQVQMLAVLAVFAAATLPFAMAMDMVVGGDNGWKLGFNYTEWASGMEFRVGDNLIFTYPEGKHTVMQVGGSDFKSCNTSATTINFLSSGSDTVALTAPGKMWFICGIGNHCSQGQKLVINVKDAAPSPSSPPQSSSHRIQSFTYQILAATAAAAAMVMA